MFPAHQQRVGQEGCHVREKAASKPGLLEQNDEFKEFTTEDWVGLDEDEDAHVREDNCDDDNMEDELSNQL